MTEETQTTNLGFRRVLAEMILILAVLSLVGMLVAGLEHLLDQSRFLAYGQITDYGEIWLKDVWHLFLKFSDGWYCIPLYCLMICSTVFVITRKKDNGLS